MLEAYRRMTAMRHAHHELRTGECRYIAPSDDVLGVIRTVSGGRDALGKPAADACAVTLINRSARVAQVYLTAQDVLGAKQLKSDRGDVLHARAGTFTVSLPEMSGVTLFGKPKKNWTIEG